MRAVLNILAVTFPFFALVLCGYIAARRAWLPLAAIPGLNTFVLYFALPCLLYRFGAGTPIARLLDASLLAVYLPCALLMVSLTIALTRRGSIGWNDASFGALVANPLPWSIVLGALASATGFTLPRPLMGTISLLAEAASPVALFAIGAMLSRSQINSTSRIPIGRYVPITLIKLVVHPLLVGGVGLSAIALGLPLERFALTVVVLVAALPSASNVALLAERFGADNGRIARIILLSTVLAFFSFSGVVALLV